MSENKLVPNQKAITIKKEKTDKDNIYTMININAMETAALDLSAGAFKLWIYFAKNQNNYNFGLSSKAIENEFGVKIKQYNNAIKELQEKGYLVKEKGYNYNFYEKAVKPKSNNEVMPKSNNELLPKDTRNNTNNTINITQQNKFIF